MLQPDPVLWRAIEERRMLRLLYHRRLRIVEPHDHGILNGSVQLLAYQVSGSSSRPLPNWILMKADEIADLELLCQHRNKTTALSPVLTLAEGAFDGDAVPTLQKILNCSLRRNSSALRSNLRQVFELPWTECQFCAVLLMRNLDTQCVYRLPDFSKALLAWPVAADSVAGTVKSTDKPYLVIESGRRSPQRCWHSTDPTPADGAEGVDMR
jgi:hypothetical protein